MPHSIVRAVTLVTLAHVSSHVAAAQFTCPEESGVFADPEQCDKYWVCYGGELTSTTTFLTVNNSPFSGKASKKLCPDGLVYHPHKGEGEDPCDNIHSVPDRCEGRPDRQRPKPGKKQHFLVDTVCCCL